MSRGTRWSSHLRLDTTEYDWIIRTYIPHYDESSRVQLDLLAAALAPSANQIIDLGGGAGSLAEAEIKILEGAALGDFRGKIAKDGRHLRERIPGTRKIAAGLGQSIPDLHHLEVSRQKAALD